MFIHLIRWASFGDDSLGGVYVDGRFICFTLEDEERYKKIAGETRIPDGMYELGIRYDSPKFGKLDERWPWHRGMIQIMKVPGFTYVYFHTGNTDDDSDACVLLGNNAYRRSEPPVFGHTLGQSRAAYARFYQLVRPFVDVSEPELEDATLRVSSYA